jgi:cytochrome c oxidase cbb3-type subunit III
MIRVALLALVAVLLAGCEREERAFRSDPPTSQDSEQVALSPLAPGSQAPQQTRSGKGKEFESNAYHVNEGKTNYMRFNCNGCHANGGGGMGPALMDEKWIYGGSIENIVATIREGRPKGMPSFRGRITDDQIWQIAAYVRSMSRAVRKDVAPGRNDSMNPGLSENRRPYFDPTEQRSQ